MVGLGNVAVGRTGGLILGPRAVLAVTAGGSRDRHAYAKTDGIAGRLQPNRTVTWSDGSIMRRVIAVAAAAISLAGCSSFSSGDYFSSFKSAPPPIQVQLESTPPGADARTSLGPGCKTPCSVSVTPPDGMTSFLVNYALPGVQPASVPVQVIRTEGSLISSGTTKVEPNPVFAELRPAGPPPKPPRKPMRPKRQKPAAAAAPEAAPADSAFPNPGQGAPPQR